MSAVKKYSIKEIREKLFDDGSLFKNKHAVPDISSVVVSVCCGKFLSDSKKMDQVAEQLVRITGQKPVMTKARKSVATFKIRQGMHLGYKITLRGRNAEDFLFRLIYLAMPRITDFRGVSVKGFDGRGNYNIGIKDASIFLEMSYELETRFGMNITLVTTSKKDTDSAHFLKACNIPFADFEKVAQV